ncbi:hypothetical protein H072_390 [Dactylellina haptotyla CBS 200.50]|uniref:Extracellular membrane protein CFEM domain-containing protein n=1 Tax=Dactylellina haptotyla (strain CBS 200.50) TaxID=1284197 RepID=S8AXC7_DACHA|nr:hypothetical protein H072_390 [Dactylellina haptotyla CBS 200.50]
MSFDHLTRLSLLSLFLLFPAFGDSQSVAQCISRCQGDIPCQAKCATNGVIGDQDAILSCIAACDQTNVIFYANCQNSCISSGVGLTGTNSGLLSFSGDFTPSSTYPPPTTSAKTSSSTKSQATTSNIATEKQTGPGSSPQTSSNTSSTLTTSKVVTSTGSTNSEGAAQSGGSSTPVGPVVGGVVGGLGAIALILIGVWLLLREKRKSGPREDRKQNMPVPPLPGIMPPMANRDDTVGGIGVGHEVGGIQEYRSR